MEETLSFEKLAKALQSLAESRNDWAGYPMLINDFKLNLAKSFPYQELNGMCLNDDSHNPAENSEVELVNTWHSYKYGYDVYIYEHIETKERWHTIVPNTAGFRLTFAMNSLGAAQAWDVKAEFKAMNTLSSMIKKHMFEYYCLTGSFIETSDRSGVTYFFRRLKPTVALKPDGNSMKILASLCLHPIGHYSGTFGGCMVPTDDIIAHLQMMRGDEHKFWAKANQHPLHEVSSGI